MRNDDRTRQSKRAGRTPGEGGVVAQNLGVGERLGKGGGERRGCQAERGTVPDATMGPIRALCTPPVAPGPTWRLKRVERVLATLAKG